ncbi:MAG: GYD domain-containing protein [Pseudomonadota bacterium]
MPRYMHQFTYSLDSMQAMAAKPQDRKKAAKKLFAAAGGRLVDLYFCFGDYDGVAISEFPSNVDAASAILAAGASGAFATMKTTVLITMDEAKDAMAKAGKVTGSYSPPAG